MRTTSLAVLLILAGLVGAERSAHARERVVVVDRGRAAREAWPRWRAVAEALLAEEGATLVLYGTKEDGRPRISTVSRPLAEVFADDAPRPGWSFEGPTDPRRPLEYVARRATRGEPVDVFLVGPFRPAAGDEGWGSTWRDGWATHRIAGSRILPVGLDPQGLLALADVPDVVSSGWLVARVGNLEAEPQPCSPFDAAVPCRTRLRLEGTFLEMGGSARAPPLVASSPDEDVLVRIRTRPGVLEIEVERPPPAVKPTSVRFSVPDDPSVLWLVPVPPDLELEVGRLEDGARLEGTSGAPPAPFDADGVQADAPHVQRYVLRRTAVGPEATWNVEGAPEALDVAWGPETADGSGLLARAVTITFRPTPGRPVDAAGVLRFREAAGRYAVDLPYRVHAPPGHVRLRLVAPDPEQPLPWEEDPPWRLEVARLDANAPPTVRVRLETEPPSAAGALRIEGSDGLDLEVPVGAPTSLRLVAVGEGEAPTARIRLAGSAQAGVEVEVSGEGRLRPRRPRLVPVEAEAARYVVRGGRVEGDPPLRLRVDADGGSAATRARLAAVEPRLEVPGDAQVSWALARDGEATWRLIADGPWAGRPRDVFRGRSHRERVEVRWEAGETPEGLEVPVSLPARWGPVGWVLVVLAALALLLGAVVAWHMRPPPLAGTLLYAIEGVSGTVGRVDLRPVGRGRRVLRSDASGRLSLEGDGHPLGLIDSTRVGGFLRLPPAAGASAGDHLLVDGLALEVGRHRLRYASGRPDDASVSPVPEETADLLGPEYDLRGGRIGTLDPGGSTESRQGRDEGRS